MNFDIRNMLVSDLEFAARCTAIEGWISETIEDFENFLAFDPGGCFVAEVDNKPVGICIATSYGSDAFIGELVVLRDLRGNKIGSSLLEKSIEYLKEAGANSIYLDGDVPAVPIYEKYGFKKICKSLRFTGKIEGKPNLNVQPINESDLLEINKIDIALFGGERTYFLERKFKAYPDLCKVYKEDGEIKGYVFCKNSNGLVTVGPLVSMDNQINPLSMLEVISYELGKINFRIGVLESNRHSVKLLRAENKLTEGEFSWRMVQGENDAFAQSNCFYAIGSAAKG